MNEPALAAALEAFAAGDVDLAVAILLDTLEDAPRRVGVQCEGCGAWFEWPGLRDAHKPHCTACQLEAAA